MFLLQRDSLCNWNEIQGNVPRHNFDLAFTEEGRKSQGPKLNNNLQYFFLSVFFNEKK